MALPQSQCCRAIRRRLRSPCDSALIPESTLASAFEQFCSISRVTSRRNGSNVPGPLENRRRTGKRHMGELNFGHLKAPAPFWELANSVDLTQWKWAPPSSFEARHSQDSNSFLASFLASLQSLDSRTQSPPIAYVDGPAPLMPSTASMEAAAPAISPDAIRVVERTGTSLDGTINFEWLTEEALDAMFPVTTETIEENNALVLFCSRLQTAVARETIDHDILGAFLRRVSDAAYDLAAESKGAITTKKCSASLLRLYIAVNDGLRFASDARDGQFDECHEVYTTLLQVMPRLHVNSLNLFEQIMADNSAERIAQHKDAVLLNIDGFLNAIGRHALSGHTKNQSTARQITKMAACLKSLDSELSDHRWILHSVSQRISTELESSSSRRQVLKLQAMRSAWLQLLARLPRVADEYLVEVCNILDSNSSTKTLTQRQICELFLARINSRFSVKHVIFVQQQLKSSSDSACYATMSSSLWETGQPRYLKMFANLLHRLGRQQDLMHVVRGLRKHVHNDIQPLANLAIGLGHPQLALWVYFRYHQSRWKSKNFWNTGFSQDILQKLMESNEMKTDVMLKALKIRPASSQRSAGTSSQDKITAEDSSHPPSKQQRMKPRLTVQRIRQTEKIATALASAPHLSDRETLERITRCIKFLQSHNTPLSPPILHALFDVVTRDLAAGKPGRTSRLKWFLGLLLKESDANNVLAVGLALKEWRRQI